MNKPQGAARQIEKLCKHAHNLLAILGGDVKVRRPRRNNKDHRLGSGRCVAAQAVGQSIKIASKVRREVQRITYSPKY